MQIITFDFNCDSDSILENEAKALNLFKFLKLKFNNKENLLTSVFGMSEHVKKKDLLQCQK